MIALLLAGVTTGCDRGSPQPSQAEAPPTPAVNTAPAPKPGTKIVFDRAHRGEAMPGVTVTGPAGGPVALASLTGRPLLLNLWATWCGPCVRELPSLDRLAARTRGRLQVVTVSQDLPSEPDTVAPWWAARGLKALALHRDPDNRLLSAYATGSLPTTVLYDAQGREVWRAVGYLEWDGTEAAPRLAEGMR